MRQPSYRQARALHISSERVCLEPIDRNSWLDAVQMMEDFKELYSCVWSLQTGGWLTMRQQIKEKAFRLGCSGRLSKPPYAAISINGVVVSDSGTERSELTNTYEIYTTWVKARAMTFAGEW